MSQLLCQKGSVPCNHGYSWLHCVKIVEVTSHFCVYQLHVGCLLLQGGGGGYKKKYWNINQFSIITTQRMQETSTLVCTQRAISFFPAHPPFFSASFL